MYNSYYYQIPTGIDRNLADHIITNLNNIGSPLMDAVTGSDNPKSDPKIRISQQRWLSTDSWIAGMIAHFIREANRINFGYKLEGWGDGIQYTEYNGKGSHYDWHTDCCECRHLPGFVRKLSVSLLLSSPDEYEGGELQIKYPGHQGIDTLKPELGQAIIFPSQALHRVKPLESGKRISLVGWYGGPPFR